MGVLTDEMTRLSDEIRGLRGQREAFLQDLQDSVSQMQAGFRRAHTEMANKAKAERERFVSGLKRTVAGQQRELRADIHGARRAWAGLSPRGQKTTVKVQRRAVEPRRATAKRSKKR